MLFGKFEQLWVVLTYRCRPSVLLSDISLVAGQEEEEVVIVLFVKFENIF